MFSQVRVENRSTKSLKNPGKKRTIILGDFRRFHRKLFKIGTFSTRCYFNLFYSLYFIYFSCEWGVTNFRSFKEKLSNFMSFRRF